MHTLRTSRGRSLPLGATALADGINFVLLCRHGTTVTLVLYALDTNEPLAEITLHPRKHRTGDHWHILVNGLPAVFRYGWRVDGPKGGGHRFDPTIVLLDPAATALSDGATWAQSVELEPRRSARRSLFFRRSFHWREDAPPLVPLEDSIIYELHVRGFTCHPSSMVAHPGTFAGLVEKIPYLRQLGITAVELLPVHEFDECDCPFTNPETGDRLRNLWGYNSIAFAAPKASYASTGFEHGQVTEFREMVRAFHAAGIEVILDVVFNHTGEGDDRGRTSSFRGLDNELYYLLGPDGRYLNFSGCGNTVNCNHPVVRQMLMTCLHFWVADMHVDGLRFDLASILGRDHWHSLNFITCHDGFTLWDLVSYNHKHNYANGEGNRDGLDDNLSWNCGVEGPTVKPEVLGLRRRQAKNFMTTLMLSQGVPMLMAGDEFLRTQNGNNNAWCQDNDISWVDWDLAKTHADFLRFVREIIALRKQHPVLRRREFFRGEDATHNGEPDVIWHGVRPGFPDFSAFSRSLAFALDGRLTGREPDCDFYVACNAWQEPLLFEIPPSPSGRLWRRAVDTALASPLDIVDPDARPEVPAYGVYAVAPFSMVVLISDP
jgi:pullulanase/glycogen debranching enzyme